MLKLSPVELANIRATAFTLVKTEFSLSLKDQLEHAERIAAFITGGDNEGIEALREELKKMAEQLVEKANELQKLKEECENLKDSLKYEDYHAS